MQLSPVPPDVAHLGLRTLKSVCIGPSGTKLSELQFRLLEDIQRHILESSFRLDELDGVSVEELSSSTMEQEFKDRLVRACIIAAC